jgi:DTW domain-containing protein YfiP
MSRPTCQHCHRPAAVCFCHTVKKVNNHWPVYILQHPKESKHAIGTAIIAQRSLQHCRTLVIDNNIDELILNHLVEDQQPLLVYPAKDSIPLDDIAKAATLKHQPRPLIFIDSTWRKSKRILLESQQLQSLQKVSFSVSEPSRYQIRKTPNDNALSTVEAIATVLSTLENTTEKYQPLLATMNWTIEQQINKMGKETFKKNYTND